MTMLQIGKLTDIGQRREQNEDSLYAFDSFIQTNDGLESFGLFIVADGTGGHVGGEIASTSTYPISKPANGLIWGCWWGK